MSRHADAILAAVERGGTRSTAALATSVIATSWRRSVELHRLDPDGILEPEHDLRALREAEERDARLLAAGRPYLAQLFAALDDPLGGISLIDRHGLMLAAQVGRSHDVHKSKPVRWLGSSVGEAALGTNGSGTCLAEERPVVVSGEEHFLSILTHTICIAAPIFGPDGQLAGALNVMTFTANAKQARVEGLIQLATSSFARRIETELFATAFPRARLMLASEAGRSPAALLALDRNGLVVGATRAARRLLAVTQRDLDTGLDLESLRGGPAHGTIADVERDLVARALARHNGNVTRAARELGISRSTFYRKATSLPRGS